MTHRTGKGHKSEREALYALQKKQEAERKARLDALAKKMREKEQKNM